MESKPRKVNDPVFGLIHPNKIEWNIIETPLFQRLKEIKQLGLSYYVYPTATHTRFSHSLGVFHMTKRICKILNEKDDNLFDKEANKNLRMAALLHDIGHFPFSHILEFVRFRDDYEIDKLPFFFHKTHEELGTYIIKNSYLNDTLSDAGYDVEMICNLIEGNDLPELIYNKIINWELDADRLDYILRDSYFTGVAFGHINFEYLINNYRPYDANKITISSKSIRDIEHIIIARFSLYDRVYIHKTISFFNSILTNISYKLISKNKYPSFKSENDFKNLLTNEDSSRSLFELTDYSLIDHLRKTYNYEKHKKFKTSFCKKLETVLFREKNFQIEKFLNFSRMTKAKSDLFKEDIKREIDPLFKNYENEIILDIPQNSFTKYIHPVFPIHKDEYEDYRKEMEKSIWIQEKNQDPEPFYGADSTFFNEINKFGITKILIYLNKENSELIADFNNLESKIEQRVNNT